MVSAVQVRMGVGAGRALHAPSLQTCQDGDDGLPAASVTTVQPPATIWIAVPCCIGGAVLYQQGSISHACAVVRVGSCACIMYLHNVPA
jgi:hypothetical protein